MYCTDATAPVKRARARDLVAKLSVAGEAVVSTQVLIELFNVLIRKQGVAPQTAQGLVLACLHWTVIDSDIALVQAAIDKSIRHQLSIWDALIVEAAARARVHTLYSADLDDGRRFGDLTLVDPFRS